MAKPNLWFLRTEGHRGDIRIAFIGLPPSSVPSVPIPPQSSGVPAGLYQVIYFRSPIAVDPPPAVWGLNIVTVENDGPSDMRVWVDSNLHPQASGLQPDLILTKGQSATVNGARLVLVRPAAPPGVKGGYVISWCCPVPGPAVATEPELPSPPPHT